MPNAIVIELRVGYDKQYEVWARAHNADYYDRKVAEFKFGSEATKYAESFGKDE